MTVAGAERVDDLTGRRATARQDERGVTTLEFVLVAPALVALIFGIIQFALWYYAGEVVRSAATSAAAAAATGGGAGSEATSVLAGPGNGIVQAPTVTSGHSGDLVTVTVTGHAPSLVLGVHLDVHATASEPLEQFTPQP